MFILVLFAIAINTCVYVGDYFPNLISISSPASAMTQRYERLLEVLRFFFCLLSPLSVIPMLKAVVVF